ncbi:MAG: rRNA maturation RNase YbeY [Terriglobia bacterium]
MATTSSILSRGGRVPVRPATCRAFLRALDRELRLAGRRFDVTLADDTETERLNRLFRKKAAPTDVLSFPWSDNAGATPLPARAAKEFAGFLGDVVISVEAARRSARREQRSFELEILQLILHGLLHLLGYDHETDRGEMNRLELDLRCHLGIAGRRLSAGARRFPRAQSVR